MVTGVCLQHSNECNLPRLMAADLSPHQCTCAMASFEGFVRNPPVFLLCCYAVSHVVQTWRPRFGFLHGILVDFLVG